MHQNNAQESVCVFGGTGGKMRVLPSHLQRVVEGIVLEVLWMSGHLQQLSASLELGINLELGKARVCNLMLTFEPKIPTISLNWRTLCRPLFGSQLHKFGWEKRTVYTAHPLRKAIWTPLLQRVSVLTAEHQVHYDFPPFLCSKLFVTFIRCLMLYVECVEWFFCGLCVQIRAGLR